MHALQLQSATLGRYVKEWQLFIKEVYRHTEPCLWIMQASVICWVTCTLWRNKTEASSNSGLHPQWLHCKVKFDVGARFKEVRCLPDEFSYSGQSGLRKLFHMKRESVIPPYTPLTHGTNQRPCFTVHSPLAFLFCQYWSLAQIPFSLFLVEKITFTL